MQELKWDYLKKVSPRLIRYIDLLAMLLNTRPTILSDYRKGDKKQHGKGLAVDVYWPDLDPLAVLEYVKKLNLFGGIGIYLNEASVPSFHYDIRPHKYDGSIATWYGCIYHINGQKHIEYLALQEGIDRIERERKTN